ncbi:unnamed protein product [Protopolystoma xenopodis]|uniref:Uncharacterized protein n=1 Tax=Protopolystoma xenopodis TaxID=117903 RepID=A0A448XEP7_9PLAT|nr:unnamed protein product [Protopolystoma xenopodis]
MGQRVRPCSAGCREGRRGAGESERKQLTRQNIASQRLQDELLQRMRRRLSGHGRGTCLPAGGGMYFQDREIAHSSLFTSECLLSRADGNSDPTDRPRPGPVRPVLARVESRWRAE